MGVIVLSPVDCYMERNNREKWCSTSFVTTLLYYMVSNTFFTLVIVVVLQPTILPISWYE
jgi:hypothetical protein